MKTLHPLSPSANSKQQLTIVFTRRDAGQQQQTEILDHIQHHVECNDSVIQPRTSVHVSPAKYVVVANNCYEAWTAVQSNAYSPDVTLRCVSTNSRADRRQVVGNLQQYPEVSNTLG